MALAPIPNPDPDTEVEPASALMFLGQQSESVTIAKPFEVKTRASQIFKALFMPSMTYL